MKHFNLIYSLATSIRKRLPKGAQAYGVLLEIGIRCQYLICEENHLMFDPQDYEDELESLWDNFEIAVRSKKSLCNFRYLFHEALQKRFNMDPKLIKESAEYLRIACLKAKVRTADGMKLFESLLNNVRQAFDAGCIKLLLSKEPVTVFDSGYFAKLVVKVDDLTFNVPFSVDYEYLVGKDKEWQLEEAFGSIQLKIAKMLHEKLITDSVIDIETVFLMNYKANTNSN